MPRNPAYILTPSDIATVSANRGMLSARIGKPVTLDFVTRKGEPRTYSGTLESLTGTRKGNESTEACTLTLSDGSQRSANLWAISAIS